MERQHDQDDQATQIAERLAGARLASDVLASDVLASDDVKPERDMNVLPARQAGSSPLRS